MIPPAALPTPPVPPAPRLDAYQPGIQEGGGMAQAFNAALDGFGARSAQMQASLRDIAARDAGAAGPPATGEVAPPSLVPKASPATTAAHGGAPGPMALMVDSFNFAIEASLVSRAASQFTSSVSTLMKGQ